MKYSTRITLALVILIMSISTLLIRKDGYLFLLTVYPLITGWIIGECLNISEERLWKKWSRFKSGVIIRLINLIDFLTGNEER
ncbi:hypothetical protein I6N96_02345 [Enterococcus sp. BWM-S5]|uniref:Uncharacterized protein n=1 Tax=Enterococcus larvae TaxID=2794352 RepID=A0ABS4CFB2_9ENTE|nr:hypothetical protein [Enterococcus larvae]MBP1045103.1 hypothetical protein [Enterococcus larvae]